MKQLPFKQRFTKFIEPIFSLKKEYGLHVIQSFFRALTNVYHIYFIEKGVFFLIQNDTVNFERTLIFYLFTAVILEFIWFLTRKIGWVVNIPFTQIFIYKKYLTRFISLDTTQTEKIGTGKFISILEKGTRIWGESITQIIEKGIFLLVMIVYALIRIGKEGTFFFFLTLILLIVGVVILIMVNKYQFQYRNKRSDIRNSLARQIVKILMSKYEIMQTGKIDYELEEVSKYLRKNSEINIAMSNGRVIQNRSIPFFIGGLLILSLYYYGGKVMNGDISLSVLTGITSILLVISGTIFQFMSFYLDFTKEFIDIEKLWDTFENIPLIEGFDSGEDFRYLNGDISLNNISFGYEKKNIITNLSLTIAGGTKVALVGSSGGGKSTLVKLISGYIRPDSGDIIIDDQKISDISLKTYYQNIGYLTQEPSVFDGTVYDNLSYAISRVPGEQELKKVIADANCEFIYDLPNGLETQIGEKGVKLSGGQKQRLAIAKIFLKNPKIIILDEPTSALDSFSEEQITKAMNNLFLGRTVIVIAHRLQTVKHADKILVLEGGEVVEAGDHDFLVKKGGIYSKMLELQSGF